MENQKLFSNDDDNNTILSNFGIEFPNCYFNSDWDNSTGQGDPFESALSSMVSSPATTTAGGTGDGMVLRELIGRLGSICNSGEIQMSPYSYNLNNSTNTSCYNTPLNSPPKLSPVGLGRIRRNLHIPTDPTLAALFANPEFAERAARYSFLGARNGECSEQPNMKLLGSFSSDNGLEGSTVSEQVASENGKKRKAVAKGKGKETTLPSPSKTDPKVAKEGEELSAKKRKLNEEDKKSGPNSKDEPQKDYIHVRARRGQATDSHSLAERVRREKISERMKFLQDLVPGCNKVIGKAVMLDEIINYVQSLQRQVEFLSMKLATMNPLMELNTEAFLAKDVFQTRGSIPENIYPLDTTFSHGYQSLQIPFSMPPLNPGSQASTFWEDDLHSIVQNHFEQNQPQNFQDGTGNMKPEL